MVGKMDNKALFESRILSQHLLFNCKPFLTVTVPRLCKFSCKQSLILTCCVCLVSLSRSQDKAHDSCREEMGTASSNQWCQQRNIKQLHAGADGPSLPPESVLSRMHANFFSFPFVPTCGQSQLVCNGLFSHQLWKNLSFPLYKGITQ